MKFQVLAHTLRTVTILIALNFTLDLMPKLKSLDNQIKIRSETILKNILEN